MGVRYIFNTERCPSPQQLERLRAKFPHDEIVYGINPQQPGYSEAFAAAGRLAFKVQEYDMGPGGVDGEASSFNDGAIRRRRAKDLGISAKEYRTGGGWFTWLKQDLLSQQREHRLPFSREIDNIDGATGDHMPAMTVAWLRQYQEFAKQHGISTRWALKNLHAAEWLAVEATVKRGFEAGGLDPDLLRAPAPSEEYLAKDREHIANREKKRAQQIAGRLGIPVVDTWNTMNYQSLRPDGGTPNPDGDLVLAGQLGPGPVAASPGAVANTNAGSNLEPPGIAAPGEGLRIHFALNSAVIDQQGIEAIRKFAAALKDRRAISSPVGAGTQETRIVKIAGMADFHGAQHVPYNRELAGVRAAAIAAALNKQLGEGSGIRAEAGEALINQKERVAIVRAADLESVQIGNAPLAGNGRAANIPRSTVRQAARNVEAAPRATEPSRGVQVAAERVIGGPVTPHLRAWLDTLAFSEGTHGKGDRGYNIKVGGKRFDGYDSHPHDVVNLGHGLRSSAAGRYQFLAKTWDGLRHKLGLPDFSPASQDAAALQLTKDAGALGDIIAGYFEAAARKCRKIWASLPGAGYGQHENSMSRLRGFFDKAVKEAARHKLQIGSAEPVPMPASPHRSNYTKLVAAYWENSEPKPHTAAPASEKKPRLAAAIKSAAPVA